MATALFAQPTFHQTLTKRLFQRHVQVIGLTQPLPKVG